MATDVMIGVSNIAPFSGDNLNSHFRVALLAPSAPIMRCPVSAVPSVKHAVTSWLVVEMEARRFPNFLDSAGGPGHTTWTR